MLKNTIRAVVSLCAFIMSGYTLHKYEYFLAFNDIDNIIGMLPVVMAIVFTIGIASLLWIHHTKQRIPITVTIATLVILSVVLFPTALQGNWWIGTITSDESEAKPDLTVFKPFSKNSQTAKLNNELTLLLTDNLPILDGATALYPIYAAFAESVYDETVFSSEIVLCTNTRGAYESLIAGEVDIIFVGGASEQQITAAELVGADLHFIPIGREAFVFLVGKNNPIDNITTQQIRNIYSGKSANWRTLGWSDGGKIIPFQRPEGSGSQTGLKSMIMLDLPIQVPQPLPDSSLIGTNSLMQQVSAEWQGVQPALGYSYRYFATTMYANPDSKLLSINGIAPTIENIQNGSYPFVGDFYAVTNGEPSGNIKLFIDWILSPQGQELIIKTGYTPISQ